MKPFQLDILRMHWFDDNGEDDPWDKCVHGEVNLIIDGQTLSDASKGSWAVSSTALFMLRTAVESRAFGDYLSEMLPCCGHMFIRSEDTTDNRVQIMGCGLGIDWSVDHIGPRIIVSTTEGLQATVDQIDYIRTAFKFTKPVLDFYNDAQPKMVDLDEWSQQGYEEYRSELETLFAKLSTKTATLPN